MEWNKRKPNRLSGYDYNQNGAYFITVCVKDKREMLWNPVRARNARPNPGIVPALPIEERTACPQNTQHLSEYSVVVENAIKNIPNHYSPVSVDKYVVMPNHIHMILRVDTPVDGRAMRAPTVSTVINQMKGYVTKQIGFSLWQKLFHDHIIRNEEEYKKIWEYIDTNPIKWENDCYYVL